MNRLFVLDCHETQLRHAFHLECLGQMLQRPYAHSCGSCFAAVSPDDAAAIREAFAAQKRARHLQIIRLRQKFAALYEPVVVPLESSSACSASPLAASLPTLSPDADAVAPPDVEVEFDDIVCPCGATRGLLESTWNWCPQCAVYVGAGLVASCKCGDAEYGDDQDQNWLICDKCGQYSHLECYPEVAEAPDDAPFLCQRCFVPVPAPAPAAPAAAEPAPRAFLHMPKLTQRCALQRAYALAFARADLLGPKREDVGEIKQKPKKPAPAKKRVLDENGQPRKRGRPRKNASASTTTSASASAPIAAIDQPAPEIAEAPNVPIAPLEALAVAIAIDQLAPTPEPKIAEAPQMPAVAEPETLATVVLAPPPPAVAEPETLAIVVLVPPPPPPQLVEEPKIAKKAAKPFACPHCPFKFDRVGKLKSHLTVHPPQHRVKVEPEASAVVDCKPEAVDDENGNVEVHLSESGAPPRSKSKRALRRQLSAQFVSEDDMTCLL